MTEPTLTASERHVRAVTTETLRVAVPMHVERLQGYNARQVEWRRSSIAWELGGHRAGYGEALAGYAHGLKPGTAANAFNLFAEGMAILSFSPGGVDFFDLHFENEHPAWTAAAEKGIW